MTDETDMSNPSGQAVQMRAILERLSRNLIETVALALVALSDVAGFEVASRDELRKALIDISRAAQRLENVIPERSELAPRL